MITEEIYDLISVVAKAGGVTIEEIMSLSRRHEVVVARHLAMSEVRYKFALPTAFVGRLFKKNHVTVIYACAAIEKAISVHDPYLMWVLDNYKSVKNKYNDASR